MSRNQIVFILGLLLVLVSLSGFPRMWKMYFMIFTGVVLMLLALRNYWLRREVMRMKYMSEAEQLSVRENMSHV